MFFWSSKNSEKNNPEYFEIEQQSSLEEVISLREASKKTSYSQGYLNSLIRKKKLKGLKIGRNWVTKERWLNEIHLPKIEKKHKVAQEKIYLKTKKTDSSFMGRVLVFLILASTIPFAVFALMQSANYRIDETVVENYDGPVISGVISTAELAQASVNWSTDVTADGFVIYSTDSGLANSKEHGSSAKTSTGQSVTIQGLSPSTTYYYKVKSTGLNGGTTTYDTIQSFTTSAAAAPAPTPSPGGGGILIIDKTDKKPPTISNIDVSDINATSATIVWETDEDSTSFVVYGSSQGYGNTWGQWDAVKNHSVELQNLVPSALYYFYVLSSDSWGNVATSEENIFTTISIAEEIEKEIEEQPTEPASLLSLEAALNEARQIINELSARISIDILREMLEKHKDFFDVFSNVLPKPQIFGEPSVVVEARGATVLWQTNIDATSQVSYVPENEHDPNKENPYIQTVGNIEDLTKNHSIKIVGLEPSTTYHYQIISKGDYGPTAKSADFIFTTLTERLEITNYSIRIISEESAEFRWITNFDTNSSVKYIPYSGDQLMLDRARTITDQEMSLVHQITINDFEGGAIYQVELSGRDSEGNVVQKVIPRFSTSKDNNPPTISKVRNYSVIIPGREDYTQAIISWTTNDPSTSRIFYQKGASFSESTAEKTPLDTNFTKEHVVVISRLDPGQVYVFKIEAIDSDGNIAKSQLYSLLTPQKRKSILDIIIEILEDTFQWLTKIFE